MENLLPFILLAIGFVLIIKGSDWFIDAVIWIAEVFNIPNIIIGATIVSLCTTLPETMVSVGSAIRGNTEIAFGNAVGSIACNTGFILAIIIILSRPKLIDKGKILRKTGFLFFLLLLLTFFGFWLNQLNRMVGLTFLAILVYFLYSNIQEARGSKKEMLDHEIPDKSKAAVLRNLFFFVLGLTMTIGGANLLITNGEIIARMLGVPDVVIGLTLTALGTSLPELVTAITAIYKKAEDISIGNVIGANILNIILVLGLSSLIKPIPILADYLSFHLPFVIAIVGLVLFFLLITKKRLQRYQGFLLFAVYSGFVYLMFR